MSAALIFARQALSAFIVDQAVATAKYVGFSWVAVESGHPETYEALLNEYAHCANADGTREFRVWSGGSDSTIYSRPSVNHAFRFWHDMMHCHERLTMSYPDEVLLGLHAGKIVARHFGTDSLEYRLFMADTVGQSTHEHLTGAFPQDQLRFALKLIGETK